jgi:hypothetical protein
MRLTAATRKGMDWWQGELFARGEGTLNGLDSVKGDNPVQWDEIPILKQDRFYYLLNAPS